MQRFQSMKKIAIIGFGTVGKAFNELVKNHHHVISYDPKKDKTYPKSEIDSSDLAVVCVPSENKKDGSCDTELVEQIVTDLETQLILIKSTVVPGTIDQLRASTHKKICFSPEYIGESSYYNPYWKKMIDVPFLIIGGDKNDCSQIFALLEPVCGPLKRYYQCDALEAEVIKYMENCFFACKISFVNEFYSMCKHLGANWHKVREGWLLDPRINRMHTSVFDDSKGFGGKCLPKDLEAIIKRCDDAGYSADFLKAVEKNNQRFKNNSSQ